MQKLVIHTQKGPQETSSMSCKAALQSPPAPVRWKVMRHPAMKKRARARLTVGERLLRNASVACAILLAVLTVKNIDLPWARAAISGVESALTMHIDLDESLGRLSFVRAIMPESVLVFLDISNGAELGMPVEGTVEKEYSAERPWLEFTCPEGSSALAVKSGTVAAVTQLSGGGWGVVIDHGSGFTTACAYLTEATVKVGDKVERGDAIGVAGAGWVFFEARSMDESINPTEMLGL